MFPFIPALILLLLQGPSNFERFLTSGIWWTGSEAVVRSVPVDAESVEELVAAVCALVKPAPTAATKPVCRAVIGATVEVQFGVRRFERVRDGPRFLV
jgi:hypothetical protein